MLTCKTYLQDDVWYAHLGQRDVACVGETQQEAIDNLLTYVAQLVEAGCLDHTGESADKIARRRYNQVFGPHHPPKPGNETDERLQA